MNYLIFLNNLKIKLIIALTLSMTALNAFSACLQPPLGNDLARGCYVESVIWSDKTASITLWQPHKSWRGDWQQGDEVKDAAVLVFTKAGQRKLLKQWCKETCFSIGSAPLNLFNFPDRGRLIVWLIDPPRSSRNGYVGDVISIDVLNGGTVSLAKDQRLLAKIDANISQETLQIGKCKYWMPDAWFPMTPARTRVSGGYLLLSHPQPIALDTTCTDYLVHDETRTADIGRVIGFVGESRMKQANQQLSYGEWLFNAGNLYWLNDAGEIEKLE